MRWASPGPSTHAGPPPRNRTPQYTPPAFGRFLPKTLTVPSGGTFAGEEQVKGAKGEIGSGAVARPLQARHWHVLRGGGPPYPVTSRFPTQGQRRPLPVTARLLLSAPGGSTAWSFITQRRTCPRLGLRKPGSGRSVPTPLWQYAVLPHLGRCKSRVIRLSSMASSTRPLRRRTVVRARRSACGSLGAECVWKVTVLSV